jgi:hypothetical protein
LDSKRSWRRGWTRNIVVLGVRWGNNKDKVGKEARVSSRIPTGSRQSTVIDVHSVGEVRERHSQSRKGEFDNTVKC